LLLDADVFAGVDEFPIGGDGVGDGGDGLLSESEVGDLAVVLGDDDVAAIDGTPGTGEKLLREANREGGLHVGVEEVGSGGGGASIVPAHTQRSASDEALLILSVELSGVGEERLSGVGTAGSTQTGGVGVTDGSGDVGKAQGLSESGVVKELGEAGGGAHGDASGCAVAKTARAGFEEASVGDPGIVPGDDDIHAVFESEGDGVLETEIELAVVDELLEARGIGEDARIYVLCDIGREEIGKGLGGMVEVEFGDPQRDGYLTLGDSVGRGSGGGLLGQGGCNGRCGHKGGQDGGKQRSAERSVHRILTKEIGTWYA